MYKFLSAAALALLLGACSEPDSIVIQDDDPVSSFSSDEERTIYALGVAIGENIAESIAEFHLTKSELEIVDSGFRDALNDQPYKVEMDVFGPQINQLANDRMQSGMSEEKAAAVAFADRVAAEPGAERTASGLVFVPITEGTGEMPTPADRVRVHYHGTLRDGSVFDSSVDRGEPVSFSLSEVIPCWTEGVQRIRVGGKAKLLCPSSIAYGDAGTRGIPGGAALLFEVELLAIE
jgi:FKBP-type peptidyl-prolyl cis-trans isomerase FkpA